MRLFAISMLDDPACEGRREAFQKSARRWGWSVDFWPAVDGRQVETFPDWVSPNRPSVPEPIKPGELGLILTVCNLYRWALDEGLEYLVVFEDDAVIHAHPRLEVPEHFDFVFFNDLFREDSEGRIRHGWGNYAYLISRRGLERMDRILTRTVEPIDLQIMMYCSSLAEVDHYITAYRDPDLPQLDCFFSGPLATHSGWFPSTIQTV